MAKDLMIGIGAQWTGKGAFKDADTAVKKLNASVKTLAGAFGLAYGTRAIVAFGKASLQAFTEDDKAARQLALTLDNLGLSMQSLNAEKFIAQLQSTYAVIDDKLRPAFQQLLVTTGDYKKSQDLLLTALNVSAATGKDLASVVNAISKAALGSTAALAKLNIGLSATQLSTMSLVDIQEYLNTVFAGAATAAANSYAGAMERLAITSANVKEIIGEGLVDAFSALGGSGGLKQTMANIENLAKFIADLTVGIARFISLVNLLVTDKSLNPFNTLKKAKAMMDKWSAEDAKKNEKQQTNAIKSTSKVLKLNKDIAKVQKDTAKLAVLQGIFDPQQAAILAALQGKITDEERKRLELMLAMEQGNVNEAQKLANELAKIQGVNSLIATQLRQLPDAKNPFEKWADYLKAIEAQIARIANAPAAPAAVAATVASNAPMGYAGAGSSAYSEMMSYTTPTTNVVVTVEGGDELTTLMRYKIAEASSSGSGVNWSQTVGAYDR